MIMSAELFERLEQVRLIPVVTIDDAQHAAPLARALARGGLQCAEITYRTDAAAAALQVMARQADMLVGAGTVLTVAQVDEARDAGAQFIVTPGLHDAVIDHCLAAGIPVIPGVATASEVAWAHDRGLRVVKFFPADIAGGPAAITALSAPYRMMRFVPTGGVNANNVAEYLRLPQVLACGGSWLAAQKLYASGDFTAVERVVQDAVALVRQLDTD
jgi:2-dehydro-3-deoxyphosphogluconate aldolase/(4S)-4-hydroxy-2-oxoglutarate aldolase